MKHLRLLLVFAFLTGISTAVFAECPMSDKQCPLGGKQCSMHSGEKCAKCGEMEQSYPCPLTNKVMKKAHFFLDNAKEIGLSDDQVKQVKDLKMQTKRSAIQENAAMEIFMLDLMSKLSEEKLDVDGINGMIDQSGSGMTQGAKDKVQIYAKLRAVLSAEQMIKAKEIWKKK